MTTRTTVDDFLAQRALAIVGVSRTGNKFGNLAYRELKNKGYRVYPINPNAETLEGDKCYHSFSQVPEQVGGVLVVVPPKETERVVRAAYEAGIHRVWLQQGAQSEGALAFCRERNIEVISGECILMFAEPAALYHRAHRWAWGVMGKLPK